MIKSTRLLLNINGSIWGCILGGERSMTQFDLTVRQWLRKNGYNDVADLINEIMAEWAKQGKRTRRNWWEVLAGDKNGKPRTIAGRTFPILKVAQIRQGFPVTENAISRISDVDPRPIRISNRWPNQD